MPITCILAAGALALAGCGASSAPKRGSKASTTALAATQLPSTSAGNSRGTHRAKTRAASRARKPAAKSSAGSRPTTTATRTKPAPAVSGSGPAAKGPTPDFCLTQAGLKRAHYNRSGEWWEANVGDTPDTISNDMVFVEGPYKTVKLAEKYAASFAPVEYGARGARYVVSATLVSKLGHQVADVAACLAGSSKSASLVF